MLNKNYFAGLIDSDFGVYIHEFFPRGKKQLRPTICFNNVNFHLIEVISSYLHYFKINHHVSFRKASKGRDKKEITIRRHEKCSFFVNEFSSFCVVRKKQLELLKSFCDSRLERIVSLGWKQNNTPYTKQQVCIKEEIDCLNSNYNYDLGHRNQTVSWLSGFIDGDGSICFVKSKTGRIIPTLDITTGSDAAKENIFQLYSRYNIKYDVRVSKSKSLKGKRKNKNIYNIYVRDFSSLEKILLLLENNLIGKKEQCILMLKYLDSRKINKFYTVEEKDIVNKVKYLNNEMRYLRDYMCDNHGVSD